MRNTRMARHPFLALLLGMFLLLPTAVHGDYRYQNLTMNDGLAANAVRNIVQDKYGYMWLGTDNGLCRYDGVRVLTYHIPDKQLNRFCDYRLEERLGRRNTSRNCRHQQQTQRHPRTVRALP